jgi:hypothetical protein
MSVMIDVSVCGVTAIPVGAAEGQHGCDHRTCPGRGCFDGGKFGNLLGQEIVAHRRVRALILVTAHGQQDDRVCWVELARLPARNHPHVHLGIRDVHHSQIPSQPISDSLMQAAKWSSPSFCMGGTTPAQASTAWTQRVRKAQPDGGALGLGGSPGRMMRGGRLPPATRGVAETSARV